MAASATSAPDWSAVPRDSTEDLQFRGRRLAFFGRAHGLISLAFIGTNTLFVGLQEGWAHLEKMLAYPGVHGHLGAIVVSFAMWLVCRGGRRGARALDVIDAAGMTLISTGYALNPLGLGNFYIVLIAVMAVQAVTSIRAVVVPSSARRTFWISCASCLPLAVISYLFVRHELHMTPGGIRGAMLYQLLWYGLIVTVATLASRVIYGLRQKVRDAREVGQYTLEEKIGEGGMGTVYRARHALLRRDTAIKLLPRDRAGARNLARFEREVQQTSRLTHPNTVAIYDYGHTSDGVFYYAMEYLDGVSLEELVERDGPQPAGRVVRIVRQLCGALAEAHARELIHRDVKPANVLLCVRGDLPDFVKVLDFGLVKDVSRTAPELSTAGAFIGTPLYIAPEGIQDPAGIGDRADLYAVGAVAYFLLAGVPPFQARTLLEVCAMHLHTQPEPPSRRLGKPVPPALEALVLRCLSKQPAERPSAAELGRLLGDLTGVPAWSDDDAVAWWKDRAPALTATLRQARRAGSVSGQRTVAVELGERERAGTAPTVEQGAP